MADRYLRIPDRIVECNRQSVLKLSPQTIRTSAAQIILCMCFRATMIGSQNDSCEFDLHLSGRSVFSKRKMTDRDRDDQAETCGRVFNTHTSQILSDAVALCKTTAATRWHEKVDPRSRMALS